MTNVVIIDDDADSREVLESLLRRSGYDVRIAAICSSPDEGKNAISAHGPELVFLDVEMPGKTGFELLQELGQVSFDVIFTTAHQAYALKALKASALDFLLKPIMPDDLQEALKKFTEKRSNGHSSLNRQLQLLQEQLKGGREAGSSIAVATVASIEFVAIDDIIRIEADHNYAKIFLKEGSKMIASRPLKHFEELLRDSGFCRVHTSHFINLKHMKRYLKGAASEVVMIDGAVVDVARNRKDEFLVALQQTIKGI